MHILYVYSHINVSVHIYLLIICPSSSLDNRVVHRSLWLLIKVLLIGSTLILSPELLISAWAIILYDAGGWLLECFLGKFFEPKN